MQHFENRRSTKLTQKKRSIVINWDDKLIIDDLNDLRAWIDHGIKKLVCAVKGHYFNKNSPYTERCCRCKTRRRDLSNR